MVLRDNNYSCLLCCHPPEESLEHLFFKCPFSAAFWEKLNIGWPDLDDRLQMLHAAKNTWLRPMFMEVFIVAAWSIWKERNNKHFGGIAPEIPGGTDSRVTLCF